MSRQDPAPAPSDCTRWQDRLPAKADDFTRALLSAQRESNARLLAKTAGVAREETLDPYGDRDWPDDYAFRGAPYHGWPL